MEPKTTISIEVVTNIFVPFFAIAMYCATVFNAHLLADPDTYWHIATGQWILSEHAVPTYDSFSYTIFGRPWVDEEWLSELFLAIAYQWGGWRGVVLLSTLMVSVTYVLLYELLARKLRVTIALGVAAVSFLFAMFHFLARPHLFSLPIIVVWTALLAEASERNRRPTLLLLPLVVLWANLHGGVTLGLILALAFAADAVIASPAAERTRISIGWGGFLIGTVLASCLTPYGYKTILETYHVFMLGKTLNFITEMRPINFQSEFFHEVVLLCLLTLVLLSGVKLGLIRALMVVGLLFLSFSHVRALAILALTVPFVVAHPLQMQFPFLRPSPDAFTFIRVGKWGPLAKGVSRAAFPAGIGLLSVIYLLLRPNDGPRSEITPAAALEYASKNHISGPVLNDYDFGGYLIFRGIKTFVDGRQILFGREFVQKVFNASTWGGANKLEALADEYKASWTLLRPNTLPPLFLDLSPNWRRVYADDIAVIHIRR